MMLDNFIKEFSKDKEKKKKVSVLGNIPHGSEALIISKISEYIKKDILLFIVFIQSRIIKKAIIIAPELIINFLLLIFFSIYP